MKILSPNNIFEKSVYIVPQGTSLLDISLSHNVSPFHLISDNGLKGEPECGQMLILRRASNTVVADLEYLNSLSSEKKEQLMKKNGVDYLFVGQILAVD